MPVSMFNFVSGGLDRKPLISAEFAHCASSLPYSSLWVCYVTLMILQPISVAIAVITITATTVICTLELVLQCY